MYEQHFGLERALFEGGIAREDVVFLGPRQQLVIANIKIALTTRDSAATLVGPVGVGKTTLASRALRMATTRLALAWVGSAPLNSDELLELLLAEFDFTPYSMGRVERLRTWRQFMSELSVTDTRICILVENAQALGVEALRTLESLTAADPNGCPGANLVIMGQAGLYEFFENPALSQLKQRIRSRQRLDPLNVAEVEAYLRCRTTAAGGEFEQLFATGVAAALHCYSAGVPRVIDNVCETALALAAARRVPQLTAANLIHVAEKVYGLAPSGPIPDVAEETTAPASQAVPAVAPAQTEAAAITPASTLVTPSEPTEAEAPVEATEPAPPASFDASDSSDEYDENVDPTDSAVIVEGNDEPVEADPAPASEADDVDLPLPSPADPEPPTLTDMVSDPSSDDATTNPEPGEPEPEKFRASAEPVEEVVLVADEEQTPEVVADAKPATDTTQALAAAKNLEDISNSMAEALFGDDEIDMLAAALEAAQPDAAPRDRPGAGLSADETSAVLQLSEDTLSEAAEEPELELTLPPASEAAS